MSNFQLNIPITKVDEEQRIVYGYATQEVLDRQGDIVDYEASKKAFSKWPGNIREQHDSKRAVGKNVHLEFDDVEKRILIGAKLSESTDGENALIKVKEGILTGFSIGGKIYKTIRDTIKGADGDDVSANRIMDYDLSEVSLVDVPACPTAQFVMVKSADGKLEATEEYYEGDSTPWFMKNYAYSMTQVNQTTISSDNQSMSKESKEIAMSKDLEKVNVVDGEERDVNAEVVEATTETVEKVNVQGGVERDSNAEVVADDSRDNEGNPVVAEEAAAEVVEEPAKDEKPSKKKADEPEMTKAHNPELKKGFYSVSELADCVACLSWIVADAEWESKYEGDKSGAAAKLKAAVAQVADSLVELTQEAVDELKTGTDVELADQPTDLMKMVSDQLAATQPDLIKSVVDAISAKVTEQLKPLEERMKSIESQPVGQAPVRAFAVMDKVADEPVAETEETALMAKADDMAANPEKYSVSERTALTTELFKLNSRKRPVPTIT